MPSRRCPVNAMDPINFLGLRAESLLAAMLTFGALKPFLGFWLALISGFLLAYVNEKVTAGQAGNYLIHVVSLKVGGGAFRKRFPAISKAVADSWTKNWGLLPPPTYQDRFEP